MEMRTEFLLGKLTGNIKSGFPAGSGRMTLKKRAPEKFVWRKETGGAG
jgi:hypothetical protein